MNITEAKHYVVYVGSLFFVSDHVDSVWDCSSIIVFQFLFVSSKSLVATVIK
jgi:hypothetical protein